MSLSNANTQPKLPRDGSKLHLVLKQLKSRDGTTIKRLSKATNWQAHSVRAALTGLRKRGYVITHARQTGAETRYALGEA